MYNILGLKILNKDKWLDYFNNLDLTNILQSPQYSSIIYSKPYQKTVYSALIKEKKIIGLILYHTESALGGLLQNIILDRGPLWLPSYDTKENFEDFVKLWRHKFPKRLGRKHRFIPECPDTPEYRSIIKSYGFSHPSKAANYQTSLIDLSLSETLLFQNLNKNWKRCLKNARSNLSYNIEPHLGSIRIFLNTYTKDKALKNYKGLDPITLRQLIEKYNKNNACYIAHIKKNETYLSSGIFLGHGKTVTYQAGWTTPEGRRYAANHMLMWESILALKNNGYRYIDLGGYHDQHTPGLAQFKQGMGGKHYCLPGMYH